MGKIILHGRREKEMWQSQVKKPERIEALSMIMVLTLMVYSVAEWKLREKLKETGESIPNQVKKQTQKPTLKWVFMLMRGITEVKVKTKSKTKIQVANLDEIKEKLIRLMGKSCEKYYFWDEGISSLDKIFKGFQIAQVEDAVIEFRKYQLYNYEKYGHSDKFC